MSNNNQNNDNIGFAYKLTLLQKSQAALWVAINNMAQAYTEIMSTGNGLKKLQRYIINFDYAYTKINACYNRVSMTNNLIVSLIYEAELTEAKNKGLVDDISQEILEQRMQALMIPMYEGADGNPVPISMEDFLSRVENAPEEIKDVYNQFQEYFEQFDEKAKQLAELEEISGMSFPEILNGDTSYSLDSLEALVGAGEYDKAIEIIKTYALLGLDIGPAAEYDLSTDFWLDYELADMLKAYFTCIEGIGEGETERLNSVFDRLTEAGVVGQLCNELIALSQNDEEDKTVWGTNYMKGQARSYGIDKVWETVKSGLKWLGDTMAMPWKMLPDYVKSGFDGEALLFNYLDLTKEKDEAFLFDETGAVYSVSNLLSWDNYLANTFTIPEYGFLGSEYIEKGISSFKSTTEVVAASVRVASAIFGQPWIGYASAPIHGGLNGAFIGEMEWNYGNKEAAELNALSEASAVTFSDAIDMIGFELGYTKGAQFFTSKGFGGELLRLGFTWAYKAAENLSLEYSDDQQYARSTETDYDFKEHAPEYADIIWGSGVQALVNYLLDTPWKGSEPSVPVGPRGVADIDKDAIEALKSEFRFYFASDVGSKVTDLLDSNVEVEEEETEVSRFDGEKVLTTEEAKEFIDNPIIGEWKEQEDIEIYDDWKGRKDLETYDDWKGRKDLETYDDWKGRKDLETYDDWKGRKDLETYDDWKGRKDLETYDDWKGRKDLETYDDWKGRKDLESIEAGKGMLGLQEAINYASIPNSNNYESEVDLWEGENND